MAWTRLLNVSKRVLEETWLDDAPPFIAISHAWSEALFPPGVPFDRQPGAKAVRTLLADAHVSVGYCWIDTISIDQNDPLDMERQIPLMADIYSKADAVAIVLASPLDLAQAYVDRISASVQGAVEMNREESWPEEGEKWQRGANRKRLREAMDCLAVFTRTPWATRVWTLQEFVLSKTQIWIGSDLIPIRIDEELFVAIPDICEMLSIQECLGDDYADLNHYYRGMVSASMGTIDRTRVMELLGNRTASLPVDEVVGTMAASGVMCELTGITTKEEAWNIWCEQAIRLGHIRWALLPPILRPKNSSTMTNCAYPSFAVRHLASSNSSLNKVEALGAVKVKDGSITLDGRIVGVCKIRCKLGLVHQNPPGMVHRDITLILFARNNWNLATQIAAAFGGGRYTRRTLLMIAQVLKHNFHRARRAVVSNTEDSFKPHFRNGRYLLVWSDFMNLQSTHMMAMNDGIAYLARLRNDCPEADLCIVANTELGNSECLAIDFGATNASGRTLLTILDMPDKDDNWQNKRSFHKIGISIATQLSDFQTAKRFSSVTVDDALLHQFSIGGRTCRKCNVEHNLASQVIKPTLVDTMHKENKTLGTQSLLRDIRRQEKALRGPPRRKYARLNRRDSGQMRLRVRIRQT